MALASENMKGENVSFDPSAHMSNIKGNDYLEVKWRLVWLRDQHPNASINTDCLHFDSKSASFKATITIPEGGSATGHGSEESTDFGDFYEKAETKAVGRALAALGFGTQFCEDFEFGADQGRVVDAPVQRGPAEPQQRYQNPAHGSLTQRAQQGRPPQQQQQGNQASGSVGQVITDRQIEFALGLIRERNHDPQIIMPHLVQRFGDGNAIESMSRQNASKMIDFIKGTDFPGFAANIGGQGDQSDQQVLDIDDVPF